MRFYILVVFRKYITHKGVKTVRNNFDSQKSYDLEVILNYITTTVTCQTWVSFWNLTILTVQVHLTTVKYINYKNCQNITFGL